MRAVIFDMDGVLVDSEPLWQIAEIESFARVGVVLTNAECLQTIGLRIDEVVAYWRARKPWSGESDLAEVIVARVITLIGERAVAKPGVEKALAACERRGLRVALCSSSARRIIDAVLLRLGIAHRFAVIHSAEHERFGKPHPAVYESTARLLGVDPEECVAIEDSPNGVRSAVAAGMRCIAVPERDDPVFAGLTVLRSLDELDAAL